MKEPADETSDGLDEPTAIELPDEVEMKPKRGGGYGFLTLAAGTFSAFLLVGLFTPTCSGATSAARLQWQDRRTEIEAAVRAAEDARKTQDEETGQPD